MIVENSAEFRNFLRLENLKQSDLAKMLEVTPRAVNSWATGDRPIPGAVKAYLRLFGSSDPVVKQAERYRIEEDEMSVREGMYQMRFEGLADWGAGVLVLSDGVIYGADIGGGRYDGTYFAADNLSDVTARVKITLPPGVQTVQGATFPFEVAFDVAVTFPWDASDFLTNLETPIGPVKVRITYMRAIPEAA